ncbi:MAG: hypothetical protein R3B90_04400 [Planctomycetaceae bacterium]
MARKPPSRLQKRREAEAAGAQAAPKKKAAKTAKKRTTRRKTKAPERKRMLWGVYSGTMKEEGRYAYDQRAQAEEKLEQLRAKSKKLYFIQPIKEVIGEGSSGEAAEQDDDAEDVAVAKKKRRPKNDEEE